MALKAVATFAVLLLALNHLSWQAPALSLVVGLFYLAAASFLLGHRFVPAAPTSFERLAWGGIALMALTALLGTVSFYLWQVPAEITFVIFALLPWLGSAARQNNVEQSGRENILRLTLGLAYLACVALTITLIAQTEPTMAIRTPWQVVTPYVFVSYALTAATLLLLARFAKHPAWLAPFYLMSLAVLALVYPIGFGFDPFIHQASEKLIATTGTLTPTPPYYVGQYALVVALHRLLGLGIHIIDTWLVPIVAAFAIPLAVMRALRPLKLEYPLPLVLGTVPLVLGLTASFTYTTPQALANLAALIAVLLIAASITHERGSQGLIWLMTLLALAAHPLTGLPLTTITLLWYLSFEQPALFGRWQRLVRGATLISGVLVVPLAFIALSFVSPGAASVGLNTNLLKSLGDIGRAIVGALPQTPHFIGATEAAYLWDRPLTLVLVILAYVGWQNVNNKGWRFFAPAPAMPIASYLVMAILFRFPNLPMHEQDFYTVRLWHLALICLLPLALVGCATTWRWLAPKLVSYLPLALGASLALTASFYLSYPRFDHWHRDTAYNTTPADVEAVQLIERDANDIPYVVLANQAVAAAAIREFGFAKYYQGHFYYPIPTGVNPLATVFSNAAERGLPTRTVIEEASRLAGVPQVYLVLNRYWADFLTLAPVAARESNQRWQVANDQVQIFRYDF